MQTMTIAQLGITIFGCAGFLLVTRDCRKQQAVGVACGLIANPFWWIMVIHTQQWIAIPVHVAYTYGWYAKAFRLWRARNLPVDTDSE